MKRGITFLAVLVMGVVVWGSGAGAQAQTSVTVSATTGMSVTGVCFTEPLTTPGSVTFSRTSTEGPLTITYHISGGPTDLNSDPAVGADHTAAFADGAATVTVVVHPAIDAVDATVTVVAGQGYVLGTPSAGVITVTRSDPQCATSTSTANTLARTGVRSTSGPLALTGIVSVALGSLLLVLSSRRKATGLR
jgi:hypothetical protein